MERKDDELERFADLMANIIAKYINRIDLDSLPDPLRLPDENEIENSGLTNGLT